MKPSVNIALKMCGVLSVSALNALRSQSLPLTDFLQPDQVLAALNKAFQMEQQNGLYFTIWYGIFEKSTRSIHYSGGGHPPVILLTGPTEAEAKPILLESKGPMVGAIEDMEFPAETEKLDAYAKLFLYSDGAYEIELADTTMWPWGEFVEYMGRPAPEGISVMDALTEHGRKLMGRHDFADDFSIVELRFD